MSSINDKPSKLCITPEKQFEDEMSPTWDGFLEFRGYVLNGWFFFHTKNSEINLTKLKNNIINTEKPHFLHDLQIKLHDSSFQTLLLRGLLKKKHHHSVTTFWSREAPDFGHLLQSEVPERIEAPRGGFRIEASSIAIDGPSPTNEAKHFLKWQVPAIAVGGGNTLRYML